MSSEPSGPSPDISATLAKACAENGLTAIQISALSGILGKLGVNPGKADWEQTARLLNEQATPAAHEPAWIEPYKVGRDSALEILGNFLPDLNGRLPRAAIRACRKAFKNKDHAAVVGYFQQALSTIETMPAPDEDELFHRIGTMLHAMASTGDRKSMWHLGWHLRVYAAHHDTPAETAASLIGAAEQWESLGFWTKKPQQLNWDLPFTVTPGIDRWGAAEKWMQNLRGSLDRILRDVRYSSTVQISEKLPATKEKEPFKIYGPTLRVLDQIGGMDQEEDDPSQWARLNPWRGLLEPMPVFGEFDPDKVYTALRREFPWMEEANERVAEMVAGLRAGHPRFAPLLLVGDPGIGKTAWAMRLAELCDMRSNVVSVSSSAGSMLISGSEREWSSSAPCLAAKVARDTGVANPMIIIDELDKASDKPAANATSVHEALLPVLDADAERTYYDLFLQGRLDLSRFSWVFLANTLTSLPSPLLDRLLVLRARRPTLEEIDQRIDAMAETWTKGQTISAETRKLALAKFQETRSLRIVRMTVERAALKDLWQAPTLRVVPPAE